MSNKLKKSILTALEDQQFNENFFEFQLRNILTPGLTGELQKEIENKQQTDPDEISHILKILRDNNLILAPKLLAEGKVAPIRITPEGVSYLAQQAPLTKIKKLLFPSRRFVDYLWGCITGISIAVLSQLALHYFGLLPK